MKERGILKKREDEGERVEAMFRIRTGRVAQLVFLMAVGNQTAL